MPNTFWPMCHLPFCFSPTLRTTPEKSVPPANGSLGLFWYCPVITNRSAKPMPMYATPIRSSFGPGSGGVGMRETFNSLGCFKYECWRRLSCIAMLFHRGECERADQRKCERRLENGRHTDRNVVEQIATKRAATNEPKTASKSLTSNIDQETYMT